MGLLDNKVALITGSASGQGAAEAMLFADEGASVVVADVSDHAGREVAKRIGPNAAFVHLDVSIEKDWEAAIEFAGDRYGDPTILINNAAVPHRKLIEDSTRKEFDRVLAVNLVGPYLGLRALLTPMRRRGGGAIVNVGSTGAMRGVGGRALYGATKWGVRGLTKAAAIEFGPYGIRVNCIQPGGIDTPMLRNCDPEIPTPDIPVPRFGTPEEIAQAALFLVSDKASYITGIDLPVDGGALSGGWVVDPTLLRTRTEMKGPVR